MALGCCKEARLEQIVASQKDHALIGRALCGKLQGLDMEDAMAWRPASSRRLACW